LADGLDRGLDDVRAEHETIRGYVKDIKEVAATLDPEGGSYATRQERFQQLIDRFQQTEEVDQAEDSIHQVMATVMISFVAGLFVGEGKFQEIRDNLDLERWFRLPKSHERRIHGHRHAGVRIVQEGPTLMQALDAHLSHPEPFAAEDLLPYHAAREPLSQKQARARRKVMKKARSKKKRPILLADLERRYRESP
jgi:hypothetical protein